MDLAQAQAMVAAAAELQTLTQASDTVKFAIQNAAFITKIEATDAAESYRTVEFKFTVEESAQIYATVQGIVDARAAAAQAKVAS